MKLGELCKPEKGKTIIILKKLMMTSCQQIMILFGFFLNRDNLEQPKILILNVLSKVFNVLLTTNFKSIMAEIKEVLEKTYRKNQKLTKLITIIENQR